MHVSSFGIKNTHLDKSSAIKMLAGDLSIHSLIDMRLLFNPPDSIGAAFSLPIPRSGGICQSRCCEKQTFFKLMIARVATMKSLDDIKSNLVHIMTFLGGRLSSTR